MCVFWCERHTLSCHRREVRRERRWFGAHRIDFLQEILVSRGGGLGEHDDDSKGLGEIFLDQDDDRPWKGHSATLDFETYLVRLVSTPRESEHGIVISATFVAIVRDQNLEILQLKV